jgi:hypothetical protein
MSGLIACSPSPIQGPTGIRKYSLTKDGALWLPQGWNSVAALYVGQGITSSYTQANQQFTATSHPTCAAMNKSGMWSSNVIRFQIAQSQLHDKSAEEIDGYLSAIQQLGLIALDTDLFDAIILCMFPQGPLGYADTPSNQVSVHTTAAWGNVANWFWTDTRFMFELINEPQGITSDSNWKSTFQTLYNSIRAIAPDNICIVPAYQPNQTTLPSNHTAASLLSGPNISYSVHAYWNYTKWESQYWEDMYGWVASYAPVLVTEVYGHCTIADGDPNGWPTAPEDFTSMLGYNRSNNIGVTAWVFDHPTDETDAVITALGSPNLYTDPWTWEPADCLGTYSSWQHGTWYKPGSRYSNWMLGH